MTERHPDDATLVAWVSGALDDAASVSFEAHVMTCMHCAARLEQAARIEATMHEAAEQLAAARTDARRDARRSASKRASMPTGLALAASLVLGLGLPGRVLSVEGDWLGAGVDDGRASVQATPLREAPTCAVPDDAGGGELCDDPAATTPIEFELEGALAMSMPEPDDGANLCVDDGDNLCVDDIDGLIYGATEPV
jgi:hypothetical protein